MGISFIGLKIGSFISKLVDKTIDDFINGKDSQRIRKSAVYHENYDSFRRRGRYDRVTSKHPTHQRYFTTTRRSHRKQPKSQTTHRKQPESQTTRRSHRKQPKSQTTRRSHRKQPKSQTTHQSPLKQPKSQTTHRSPLKQPKSQTTHQSHRKQQVTGL